MAQSQGTFDHWCLRYYNDDDNLIKLNLHNAVDKLNNNRYDIMALQVKDRITTSEYGKINSTTSKVAIPAPPTPPLSTKIKDTILSALILELFTFSLPSRDDPKNIAIVQDKFSTQVNHILILVITDNWGFKHPTILYREELCIARVVSLLVSYDNEFKYKFSTKSILCWQTSADSSSKRSEWYISMFKLTGSND